MINTKQIFKLATVVALMVLSSVKSFGCFCQPLQWSMLWGTYCSYTWWNTDPNVAQPGVDACCVPATGYGVKTTYDVMFTEYPQYTYMDELVPIYECQQACC